MCYLFIDENYLLSEVHPRMSEFWQIIDQVLQLDFTSLYEFSPLAIFFIILCASFVTEDGACLAAGALAGQGRISFALALSACFAGIFIGDIGLYWIGRLFGNSLSKTRLFNRLVSKRRLNKAADWLNERGPQAIVISRFVSGLRLPTYLAAGFLKTNFATFALWFFLATAIWTPILVGSATVSQQLISPKYLLLSILILFVLYKIIFTFSSWRKRRLFIGRLKRIANWEFWPLKIFYFPVVLYAIWLALKHRSLTVFTCANPAILAGGFIGESKHEIYTGLRDSAAAKDYMLEHTLVPEDASTGVKQSLISEFIGENVRFPFVVKPDVGERGSDVTIAKSLSEAESAIDEIEGAAILQEFAAGEEVSIFYYRYPSSAHGTIFSITEKEFPRVTGDGESTLEELILSDERAVCLAKKYFERNRERLEMIPEAGEKISIVDIGTHSQGAIFKDGERFFTDPLERKIDEICRGYEGFYFGRFDIRTKSFESFGRAEDFKIVELNGVTSESTNIYDKRYTLFNAYRILFKQWRIAFEIGAENKKKGLVPTPATDLIRLLFGRSVERVNSDNGTAEICA